MSNALTAGVEREEMNRDDTSENFLIRTLDRHHRLAAEVRDMLYNGGAGPNLSQLKRCDVALREIAGIPPESEIELDAIMSALGQAFQRAGSRTSRDARVEEYLREILSARPEHKDVFNESGREKLRNDGKRRTTKP